MFVYVSCTLPELSKPSPLLLFVLLKLRYFEVLNIHLQISCDIPLQRFQTCSTAYGVALPHVASKCIKVKLLPHMTGRNLQPKLWDMTRLNCKLIPKLMHKHAQTLNMFVSKGINPVASVASFMVLHVDYMRFHYHIQILRPSFEDAVVLYHVISVKWCKSAEADLSVLLEQVVAQQPSVFCSSTLSC